MQVESIKPKLFGHLLAQQIANNYVIDSANRIEPVQNFGFNVRDCINIIIEDKKKMLEEAKKYCAYNVFWINRFKLNQRNTGITIC